jgi:transposase
VVRPAPQTGWYGRDDSATWYQPARRYIRTLLIHGTRSLVYHGKHVGPWAEELQKRCSSKVVAVALSNKMARTIRAIFAHDRPYDPTHATAKSA